MDMTDFEDPDEYPEEVRVASFEVFASGKIAVSVNSIVYEDFGKQWIQSILCQCPTVMCVREFLQSPDLQDRIDAIVQQYKRRPAYEVHREIHIADHQATGHILVSLYVRLYRCNEPDSAAARNLSPVSFPELL